MDRIRLGILQVNHDKSESIGDHFPDDAHRFRDLFDALEQRFSYRVYMTIGDEVPESLDEQDAFLTRRCPCSMNTVSCRRSMTSSAPVMPRASR